MTSNAVVHHPRHRSSSSSSSDRFLTVFSPPHSDTVLSATGDNNGDDDEDNELNEDDVFWSSHRSTSPSDHHLHHISFSRHDTTGILAALPERQNNSNLRIIFRTTSLSSSTTSFESFKQLSISSSLSSSTSATAIPSVLKREVEREKYQHSAPVKVPVAMVRKVRNIDLMNVDDDMDGGDDDDELLPPHEIVARGSAKSPKTTFSVLEGVGRTLKGRDLRQVRNAVWRQTGFLD